MLGVRKTRREHIDDGAKSVPVQRTGTIRCVIKIIPSVRGLIVHLCREAIRMNMGGTRFYDFIEGDSELRLN
jgi:hypothetical protein